MTAKHSLTRRDFLRGLGAFALVGSSVDTLSGCGATAISGGRLTARPHRPRSTITPGLVSLGLTRSRDAQLYVPTSYRADRPATLILGLHGATQDSDFILYILRDAAESAGHLLLAPNSREVTWDLMHGASDEDERLLDQALDWCFDHCNVDPARLVIAGFSDGASAALSLGLINGDLFPRIVALSPRFIVGHQRRGTPSIFISHGRRDRILPLGETSNPVVPELRRQGYSVTFREVDGPHRAPPEVVADAIKWLQR